MPHPYTMPLLACLLLWTATTTYTDGTLVIGPVRYRVHFDAKDKKTPPVVLADTDQTQAEQPVCEAGDYWVTAYQVQSRSDESKESNVVTVKPGKGKP